MTGETLAELIQAARGKRKLRQLLETAEDAGAPSKLSTWQQWSDPSIERKLLPDPATLRAFALGLGLSEYEVLLAAARQVGLNVGGGNNADLVLPGMGGLPREDRDVLYSLAMVLRTKL